MKHIFNWGTGFIVLGFLFITQITFSQEKTGKMLILHCDDLGVAHSVNQAAIDLFEKGYINSASIMVPTPWFHEIAKYGVEHPDFDLGLHLTLTSEWPNYKWGPVSGRDKVPSLVDEYGYMYATTQEAIENIKPEEAEIEIREQIELALAHGLNPSHLDSHMGVLFYSPDLFKIYLKLGKEYGIPVFAPKKQLLEAYPEMAAGIDTEGFLIDNFWGIEPTVPVENWTREYVNFVNELPGGVSLIIVHLGYDNYELEHIMGKDTGWGSAWRQRDTEAMMDREFTEAIRANDIILTNYRELYSKPGKDN